MVRVNYSFTRPDGFEMVFSGLSNDIQVDRLCKEILESQKLSFSNFPGPKGLREEEEVVAPLQQRRKREV